MPDTVIDRINTLGRDQTKLITFTYRHWLLIEDLETLGLGANSDYGEVEFTGVDTEIEEEEMEMPNMEPEGNVEIPGMDMEGKEPPPHKSL